MIHPRIEQHTIEDVNQAAYDYLIALLCKISMVTTAKELHTTVPTLLRSLESGSFSYLMAAHIIFMCETNIRIGGIMDSKPRHNAYYERED